jgi:hypothetical protein
MHCNEVVFIYNNLLHVLAKLVAILRVLSQRTENKKKTHLSNAKYNSLIFYCFILGIISLI